MPVLIKASKSDQTDECAIIELQGDLKSHSDSSFEDQFIGDLHYTKSGIPLLIIGHHLLYGKVAKMEKPFALMEKQEKDGKTCFVVKAIIRNKIIFKTRPKPIVGESCMEGDME
ncbi:chromosome transmission fidelity protein 8 homolog [Diabrotica virgifera virgifera]|uniref:Chromosome transmission fidelity protein 8 homolog n=1 Tax=Diabrotica virgifera virgifera TaxID=50390 RepID=A0A6P7FT28_DIAVI|nr:chromosome transmission fidelity protein 8 homolog [Diabrotica virgifera virgifera]